VDRPRVVCLARPWGRHVWTIDLQAPLDPAGGGPATVPWGVRLAGGQRCLLLQGASDVIDGQRVNYYCSGTLSLLGRPDRHQSRWRIRAVHYRGGRYRPGGRATIATAYFGAT
jgi:hypothetical protein